jgi:hypothetical protein
MRTSGIMARTAGSTTGRVLSASESAETSIPSSRSIRSTGQSVPDVGSRLGLKRLIRRGYVTVVGQDALAIRVPRELLRSLERPPSERLGPFAVPLRGDQGVTEAPTSFTEINQPSGSEGVKKSSTPVLGVAIRGRPEAAASSRTRAKPSSNEGSTKTSHALYNWASPAGGRNDPVQLGILPAQAPPGLRQEAENVRSGAAAAGISELQRRAESSEGVLKGTEVTYSGDGRVAEVSIPTGCNGERRRVQRRAGRDSRRGHPRHDRPGRRRDGARQRGCRPVQRLPGLVADGLPLIFAFVFALTFLPML